MCFIFTYEGSQIKEGGRERKLHGGSELPQTILQACMALSQ
jgi:hypothetical protein